MHFPRSCVLHQVAVEEHGLSSSHLAKQVHVVGKQQILFRCNFILRNVCGGVGGGVIRYIKIVYPRDSLCVARLFSVQHTYCRRGPAY